MAMTYISSLLLVTIVAATTVLTPVTVGAEKIRTCERIECPTYEVIHSDTDGEYEIRKFNTSVMWMSTSPPIKSTSFTSATRVGFLRLFKYIQGANKESATVPMTAPVLTEVVPSDGPFCESSFTVSFMVPTEFRQNVPSPDASLDLEPVTWTPRYVAVRSFGGFVRDSTVGQEAARLQKSLSSTPWADAIESSSGAYGVAQYNAPFEFLHRHNEIWFLLKDDAVDRRESVSVA